MITRIKHILEQKNLSPSRFADQIGVPRSTISHILSGRNKASLEVVQKIVSAFPDVPVEWLLMGKGSYRPQAYTLFGADERSPVVPDKDVTNKVNLEENDQKEDESYGQTAEIREISSIETENTVPEDPEPTSRKVIKIFLLHSDGTFSDYKPTS